MRTTSSTVYSKAAGAHPDDLLAVPDDPPADVREKVLDGLDQGALARAVPAEDGHEFSRLDREGDLTDDKAVVISRREVVYFENAHGFACSPQYSHSA
jgi:hypothetical protein